MAPERTDILDAVTKDLRGHIHAASLHAFLDRFFPVPPEDVEAILRLVSQPAVRSGYDGKRWKGIPKSKYEPEVAHYKPIAAVANVIRKAAESLRANNATDKDDDATNKEDNGAVDSKRDQESNETDEGDTKTDPGTPDSKVVHDAPIDGVWLDRHSKTPHGKSSATAPIRPDLVFVSFPQAVKDLDQVLEPGRRSARLAEQGRMTKENSEQGDDVENKNMFASEDTDTLEKVWWQQIQTPFELKRRGLCARDALLQLFSYMRSILQEQLDRRFTFGLLLCFDHLTICMCDRSGAIFTKHAFNIHKYPERFIRVIAGFSLLKPHQLGWDPDMKVFLVDENRGVPSYTLNPERLGENHYRTHWLIQLLSQDGSTEKVVTVRGISLARAEVMCGRATVVWEAVKHSEFRNPKSLYILKRYWRPTEVPSNPDDSPPSSAPITMPGQTGEAIEKQFAPERLVPEEEFYDLLGVGEERLEFSGDAIIEGTVDSTLDFIRDGLASIPAEWEDFEAYIESLDKSTTEVTGSKRKRLLDETDDNTESTLPWNTTGVDPPHVPPVKIIPRVHTQLLMKDPGPCVRYFSSLMELISVTEDCIRDHKQFHASGVLHRDVSPGNMVIIPKKQGPEAWVMPTTQDEGWDIPTKGRLIDFDHAKHTPKAKKTTLTSSCPISDEDVMLVTILLRGMQDRIGRDIIETALVALGADNTTHVVDYIKYTVAFREKYFGLTPPEGGKYCCANLGWDRKDIDIPDFDDHQARLGFRSGTLPYMSYEVLAKQIFAGYFGHKPNLPAPLAFFHDSVHDMDSFNWVLVHICLTRKGPGMNMCRDELRPEDRKDSDQKTKDLRAWVKKLFDADETTVVNERGKLLTTPSVMINDILPCFHPYFDPLKPMIERWWHTLVLAYHYRAFEYFHIHDFFLEILQLTMQEHRQDPSFNGTDGNEDTKHETQRRIERYDPKYVHFGRPRGIVGQDSITATPKKDVQSTPAPAQGPIPDSPTPANASRSSRKKPRV